MKHDHKKTKKLKALLFGAVMILPAAMWSVQCINLAINKNYALESVSYTESKKIDFNQLINVDITQEYYHFNEQTLLIIEPGAVSTFTQVCTFDTIPAGHKVLCNVNFLEGNAGNKDIAVGGYSESTWQGLVTFPKNIDLTNTNQHSIFTLTKDTNAFRLFLYSTTPISTSISCYVNYFDLTRMFGGGNEPTYEQFVSYYPNKNYQYTNSKTEYIENYSTTTGSSFMQNVYYSYKQAWDMPILSWTKANPILQPIQAFTGIFGINPNNVFNYTFTYWITCMGIYIVFDIIIEIFVFITHQINKE